MGRSPSPLPVPSPSPVGSSGIEASGPVPGAGVSVVGTPGGGLVGGGGAAVVGAVDGGALVGDVVGVEVGVELEAVGVEAVDPVVDLFAPLVDGDDVVRSATLRPWSESSLAKSRAAAAPPTSTRAASTRVTTTRRRLDGTGPKLVPGPTASLRPNRRRWTNRFEAGTPWIMAKLTVEVDADEAGLDAERLARIDAHFAHYVDDGRLPGWSLAVSRRGRVAHLSTYGRRDIEADRPVDVDTLFRIYSMTKPLTSVAAMMLHEEGAFALSDPVSRIIPAFADARVYRGGSALRPVTEPLSEPVRIWHLLTHTAGLTYGFHHAHPVDTLYRQAGFEWGTPAGLDLAACCDVWAGLPLLFQPGEEWNYSVAADVLGRVVEVASGQSLDTFFAERILGPLGMDDTAFWVDEPDQDRLAALYLPLPGTAQAVRGDAFGQAALAPPDCLSGGGGLVSSAGDYVRFASMLLGGGELDGVRLLGPRTVGYMASNHLPGGADLESFGRPLFAETTFDGIGFGLGFSVVVDPVKNKVPSSVGEFGWGGAASTVFWVDPAEEITVVFLTQLLPSSTHPIRSELKALVSQAIVA